MPRSPPPPLNEPRMDVVAAAWHKVANGADSVTLSDLVDAHDAGRHPRVLDGNMSLGQAREIIRKQFADLPDGVVTFAEFLQYHVKMSNEVDRSRSIDRDGTFVNNVVTMWRLDKDSAKAMQPTGIIATTLECPVGLKRTRNMDLVWTDPADRSGLIAFRGAVKTRFARADLPENIRGHFAYADEITDRTVKQSPSRSAVMTALSIVWTVDGTARGFREVVSPNVDQAQLPETLKSVIIHHDEAERTYTHVEWLPLAEVYNPAYQKSSEAFGQSAYDSAQQVLELKKKVYDGTSCGIAWHGHTGKFTDSFNGGPTRFSGLNTAPSRR
jgi:hypothetical protein